MIDLHMHTKHSDGTYSVKEILKEAEKTKLEIISITDHDSVKAYYEILEDKTMREMFKGKIIIGSEIKCYLEEFGVPIEILGYGIDIYKIEEYFSKKDIIKIQRKYLEYLKKVGKEIGLTFSEEEIKKLIDICKENNLYMSGGSDFHGENITDTKLGVGKGNLKIPKEITNSWINKISII